MSFNLIFAVAAEGTTQGTAGQTAPPSAFGGMIPLILVFGIMIFFMIRSHKKQQQKQQQMIDRIVKGSRVLLNCGIYGKVVVVREKTLMVELAGSMAPVEVLKGAVAALPDEEEAAPAKEKDASADEKAKKA